VIRALGVRSVRQTFRRPQLLAPILVFPTLLLAVQTGGAAAALGLPGFPRVDSFLQFMLAGAMMQSVLLAGNSGGIALAVDIEMGFTDRLFAAPISRYAIVLGRLMGTAALGAFATVWFLVIGLIFGAPVEDGWSWCWSSSPRWRWAASARRSHCAPAPRAWSRACSRSSS
jgi:ABC-2 type transport system permease protein